MAHGLFLLSALLKESKASDGDSNAAVALAFTSLRLLPSISRPLLMMTTTCSLFQTRSSQCDRAPHRASYESMLAPKQPLSTKGRARR